MTFKVNFLYQKLSESFSFFFHWRISILEHIFCYWHFLITLIFKAVYFLKWCPILTPPHFNNYLWVCWFLGKNLPNFVPPVWKLHNPYCHIQKLRQELFKLVRSQFSVFEGLSLLTKYELKIYSYQVLHTYFYLNPFVSKQGTFHKTYQLKTAAFIAGKTIQLFTDCVQMPQIRTSLN